MLKMNKLVLFIFVLLGISLISVIATTFISECQNGSWRLENSELVVDGVVKDIERSSDTTYVTLIVKNYIKGSGPKLLNFQQPGGRDVIVDGYPEFVIGEEVIVYLNQELENYTLLLLCGSLGKTLIDNIEEIKTDDDTQLIGDDFQLILNDSYNIGEEIEIKVKNNGKTKINFVGNSGCAKFFKVSKYRGEDKKLEFLNIANPNRVCTLALINLEINPGETKTIGTWDQKVYDNCINVDNCNGKQVEPGMYKIHATFNIPASIDPYVEGGELTISKEIEIDGKNSGNKIIKAKQNNNNIFINFWNWIKTLFRQNG